MFFCIPVHAFHQRSCIYLFFGFVCACNHIAVVRFLFCLQYLQSVYSQTFMSCSLFKHSLASSASDFYIRHHIPSNPKVANRLSLCYLKTEKSDCTIKLMITKSTHLLKFNYFK